MKTCSFPERYLVASHSLQCSAVATVCTVKGCNKIVRRGQKEEHISRDQMRHFSLLEEEKRNILWEVNKRVSFYTLDLNYL